MLRCPQRPRVTCVRWCPGLSHLGAGVVLVGFGTAPAFAKAARSVGDTTVFQTTSRYDDFDPGSLFRADKMELFSSPSTTSASTGC